MEVDQIFIFLMFQETALTPVVLWETQRKICGQLGVNTIIIVFDYFESRLSFNCIFNLLSYFTTF